MRSSPRSRRSRLTVGLTATATAAASVVLGLAAPAQAAGTVSYPHSVPAWATSARDAGKAPAAQTTEGEIYLPLRNAAVAEQLASQVSTPGSALYRHWMAPQQWINQFAPTAGDYNKLVSWLKRQGLTITGTPQSRLFVVFRGTNSQLDQVFGTAMHDYDLAGKRLTAPSAAPQVPADIAPTVSGMELDQGRLLTHPDSVTPSGTGNTAPTAATSTATPQQNAPSTAQCSQYYGEHQATLPAAYGQKVFNTYLCGYVPSQLRSAYGVSSSGADGTGQKVAIIDAYASPTIHQDVNTYSRRRGEPDLQNYAQITPKTFYDEALCQFPSGWQGEQTLDVEAVHGIAPKASVLYVGGFNCSGGIDVALSQILDQGLATIVSNSYGDVGEDVPSDAIMGQENQHLQAVAEGIGLYYSSGDYGDEAATLGTPEPDYEASSPWVTSVGGTSTGIDRNGRVVAETGWGSHRDQVAPSGKGYVDRLPGAFRFGAGGGRSTLFAQPDYQRGAVPAGLAADPKTGKPMRVSPDVAADADPYTGMLIGLSPIVDDTTLATGSYTEEAIGGTSLASPLVAATMALVQQSAGQTLGFANPAIYGLHQATPSVPRDVATTARFPLAFTSSVSGNTYLVTGNRDTSLTVRRGYDDVTGLGAIDFGFLRSATTR